MNSSWRTNIAGAGVIFGTILHCGMQIYHNLPVDFIGCGSVIAAGLGLFFARDQAAHVEDVENKSLIPKEK